MQCLFVNLPFECTQIVLVSRLILLALNQVFVDKPYTAKNYRFLRTECNYNVNVGGLGQHFSITMLSTIIVLQCYT